MRHRLVPAAVAALGLFLAAATALAVSERAFVPAAVFAAAAAAHLGVAAGLVSRSRPVAVLGAVVGALDAILVAAGMAFIVGIETGVGVDLGARWFAPLNGYMTIAVAAAIGAVAVALVARGIEAIRAGFAVPAPRG